MSMPLTMQAAKASLISSLAKSQQALARILNSIANVADQSPETAKLLRDNVRMLTELQRSMAGAVYGTDGNNRGKWHNNSKSQSAKAEASTGIGTNKAGMTGKLWDPHKSSRSGKTGSSPRKAGSRRAKK